MSLRMIARDLYRLQQAVDRLERQLADSSPQPCDDLRRAIAKARDERDYMRRVLDGRLERSQRMQRAPK